MPPIDLFCTAGVSPPGTNDIPASIPQVTPAAPPPVPRRIKRAPFLRAKELLLPGVSDSAREDIRRFLAPLLGKVSVKTGDCWNVAQKFMRAANSPRVQYVEGVYDADGVSDCPCCSGPTPHAWNTVDGSLVDLILEFRWSREPALNRNWLHEPFKEYSLTEIQKYLVEVHAFDGYSLTSSICYAGLAQDFGYTFTDEVYERCKDKAGCEPDIFEPATTRLLQRLKENHDLPMLP